MPVTLTATSLFLAGVEGSNPGHADQYVKLDERYSNWLASLFLFIFIYICVGLHVLFYIFCGKFLFDFYCFTVQYLFYSSDSRFRKLQSLALPLLPWPL